MDISSRKKKILAAVIEEYIRTAEPVGSKAIAASADLGCSSATIRNELAELVAMGYLEQPHTSAGRVPTPLGYRMYVNELMEHKDLTAEETQAITQSLTGRHQRGELMTDASRLASQLTNYPAVTLTTSAGVTIRRFDLIYLDANSFIIVLLLSDDTVKNKLVHLPVSAEQSMIQKLAAVFNAHFTGIREPDITPTLISSVERAAQDNLGITAVIAAFAIEVLTGAGAAQTYLVGESQLLHQPEFRDPDKAHRLMSYLSDGSNLLDIPMEQLGGDNEVRVLIGPENVAEELREYMAKLGVRTIDELVGRTDLLKVKPAAPGSRASKMDLDCILHNPAIENSNVHFVKEDTYDFHLENTLDMKVLMKKFKLSSKNAQSVTLDVSNTDRAFGAIFGSEITRKYGNSLPDDVYTAHCVGAGGQSFGAFIPGGLTLDLVGDCNDYMGKGLSGGKIVVRPPKDITFKPEENIITGNVALYGATSGKAFISGVAGERFAVRNSGATAVVEGVGDHGCEYMTGGTVVVLGQTGKNFAAGMTGGIAYVLDENWDFYQRVNKETVSLEPVEHKYDVATLKELIREHVEATGSPRGKEILDNFSEFLPKFKKVLPYDYDRMLRVIASVEERGLDGEQAQIEAFYTVQKKK